MEEYKEIPEGYKRTKVGVIPQEWEVKRIKDIGKVYSGGTPDTSIKEYWDGDVLWCTPTDITSLNENIYLNETTSQITTKGLENSSAKLLPPDSILVCTRATIGKAAIAGKYMCTNQGFKNIIPNPTTNTLFLYYLIIGLQPQLIRLGNGSTFLEVSKTDFENLKIQFPPLSEQQKIAHILSTWDKAIEKQTTLIEKLETRKRGLMQQLLTGKKRLKGFSGEWIIVKLGDYFGERVETNYINLPLLSIGQNGVYPQKLSEKKDTSNEDKSKYKRICINDIGYNTMRMWQGRSALSQLEGIVSPAYTILTPKTKANSLYFSYLFKTSYMQHLFWRNSQGLVNDTLTCKYRDFSIIKCLVPSLEEQTAIATILSQADLQIELAKKKLSTYQQQKKALMQQLLTGKTRVRIDS